MNRQQRRAQAKLQAQDKPQRIFDQALAAHQQGQVDNAIAGYETVLRRAPRHPGALHFLGLALYRKGQAARAVDLLRAAISSDPGYADAHNNLGNMHKEAGRTAQARDAYEAALRHNPRLADAHNNLGVLSRQAGDLAAAATHFRACLEANANHVDCLYNLGMLHRQTENTEDALRCFRRVVDLKPDHEGAGRALTGAYHAAYSRHHIAGNRDAVVRILEEWLTWQPDNPEARHALAAYTRAEAPARAPDDYVRQVFDRFSDTFDQVLEGLEYQAPQHIAAAVAAIHEPVAALAVVDLGCGTGLCGPLLRPYARQLTGIDLSPGMLEKARKREVYDTLIEAELTAYLQAHPASADLIISADTLVYLGDLAACFTAAAGTLRPGGYLVFTVEHDTEDSPDGYRLLISGRYCHGETYLRQTLKAAGLCLTGMTTTVLRQERKQDVAGLVVTARRPGG